LIPKVTSFSTPLYVIWISFGLHFLSAALTPSASVGDLFSVGGIRFADVISVLTLFLFPKAIKNHNRSILAGLHAPLWILLVSLAWASYPIIEGSGFLDARAFLAELQFPVYGAAVWVCLSLLSQEQLPRLFHGLANVSIFCTLVGFAVGLVPGNFLGADFSTLACVAMLLALVTYPQKKIAWMSVFFIALYSAVLSNQAAALAFSVPAMIFGLVAYRPALNLRGWAPFAFLGFGVLGTYLLVTNQIHSIVDRIAGFTEFVFFRPTQISANESRISQYLVGWSNTLDNPILGSGFGVKLEFYDPGVGRVTLSNLSHNILLDVLIRFGIPITVVAIALICASFYKRYKASILESRVLARTIFWASMAIVGKGIVESVLFKPRLAFVLALLLSILWASMVTTAERGPENTERAAKQRGVKSV
jgi:hypothetical protein